MTQFKPITLPNVFVNPFKGIEKTSDKVSRVQTNVPTDLHFFIKCLRQGTGTIETTVNILYAKLYNECLRRGIHDFTSATEFERLVVNCRFVIPGDDGRSPMSAAQASNVSAGVAGRSSTDTPNPGQPASIPGNRSGGKGRHHTNV